jgi:hypothetical protein
MSKDLQTIVAGWRFEPSAINARWITGVDGRPHIQLRLDLGLLQMEPTGRPDGARPRGHGSLLDHYLAREQETGKSGEPIVLGENECHELQQEAAQYYYRYLSLYALRDLDRVIEDTGHNLRIINLAERYAEDEELAWQFAQFFPYVRMMNARARAERAVEQRNFAEAVDVLERGIHEIRAFWGEYGDEEDVEECREIGALLELLAGVEDLRPRSEADRLRDELEEAVAAEDFERAARLRDRLRGPPPTG